METNNNYDEFYDKEFTCNDSTLCRRDLESLPVPFYTEKTTDEVMQKIIDDTDAGTRQTWKLRDDEPLRSANEDDYVRNDRINETWWEELELAVVRYDVPYYEDLDNDN